MKLTELELSVDILKMSRNASVLASFAGALASFNLPKIGLITYVIFSVLILFIIYALIIASKEQQRINKFNQNIRKHDIKTLRSMVSSLMDENLKEERNDNISFSLGIFALFFIITAYSVKMNQLFMGISAFLFLFSSLSYAKVSILYQQLINEVVIEEKKLIKTINSIKSPKLKKVL